MLYGLIHEAKIGAAKIQDQFFWLQSQYCNAVMLSSAVDISFLISSDKILIILEISAKGTRDP